MSSFFEKIKKAFASYFDRRKYHWEYFPADLDAFFDGNGDLASKFARTADSHYSVFHIWKDKAHTKTRTIEAPDAQLKEFQRLILRKFLYGFRASPRVHGFVRGRSIVSNAKCHTGKRYVIKFDLKDFFPSITAEMTKNAFHGIGRKMTPKVFRKNFSSIDTKWNLLFQSGVIPPEIEENLDVILNLCMFHGRLPQGAPTSPAIANIVFGRILDAKLERFANWHKMTYTRYADDLTFSTNNDNCYKYIPVIRKIIEQNGFTVNGKKLNVLKAHQRQTVTGLVVNRAGRVGVKRNTRMKLRAWMHQIRTGKIPLSQVNMQKLRGHVAFLAHADYRHGKFFTAELEKIEKMIKGA